MRFRICPSTSIFGLFIYYLKEIIIFGPIIQWAQGKGFMGLRTRARPVHGGQLRQMSQADTKGRENAHAVSVAHSQQPPIPDFGNLPL